MTEQLIGILILLVGYVVGYWSGKRSERLPTATPNIFTPLVKSIQNKLDPRAMPGIIRRPTAGALKARNEPEKQRLGRRAVKESLDQIPELQEHKKLVNDYKKARRGIL